MSDYITVTARDLRAGMRVRDGRRTYTVASNRVCTIDGGGEFPDYDMHILTFEEETFAPGRGRVPVNTQAEPDTTYRVITT